MRKLYYTPQCVISFLSSKDVLTASTDPTIDDMDWDKAIFG